MLPTPHVAEQGPYPRLIHVYRLSVSCIKHVLLPPHTSHMSILICDPSTLSHPTGYKNNEKL